MVLQQSCTHSLFRTYVVHPKDYLMSREMLLRSQSGPFATFGDSAEFGEMGHGIRQIWRYW